MRVYIAGPYTKGDVVINVREAFLAADAVVALGHEPFIPHASHLWHLISPHEYEFWMERDMAWLEVCDALLRLPGESSGADREVSHMQSLGKPIYDSLGDLSQRWGRE